jgi:tetratricopeptide (TPR) repeat protein
LGTCLCLLLLVPSALAAEGKDSRERAARKACLSGDYAKGVEILSDLFLDSKNPTYIYNQGRCYEQNNHFDEALSRFREYLRKAPALKTAEKEDVEKHIAECEALLNKSQPAAAPAPVVAPVVIQTPAAPAPTVTITPEAPPVQVIVQKQEPAPTVAPPQKSYGFVIAGICTGLVGLGSVGVGLYYYDQAKQLSPKEATTDNKNAGNHAEMMQWIFYSAGGVALATGALMTILGWPSSEPSATSTSLAPMVGPGLAGIAAHGAF